MFSESFWRKVTPIVILHFSEVQVVVLQVVILEVTRFICHKVGEKNLVIARKHDVLRFDVSMYHCLLVDLAHSTKDLENQPLLLHEVHLRYLVSEFIVETLVDELADGKEN